MLVRLALGGSAFASVSKARSIGRRGSAAACARAAVRHQRCDPRRHGLRHPCGGRAAAVAAGTGGSVVSGEAPDAMAGGAPGRGAGAAAAPTASDRAFRPARSRAADFVSRGAQGQPRGVDAVELIAQPIREPAFHHAAGLRPSDRAPAGGRRRGRSGCGRGRNARRSVRERIGGDLRIARVVFRAGGGEAVTKPIQLFRIDRKYDKPRGIEHRIDERAMGRLQPNRNRLWPARPSSHGSSARRCEWQGGPCAPHAARHAPAPWTSIRHTAWTRHCPNRFPQTRPTFSVTGTPLGLGRPVKPHRPCPGTRGATSHWMSVTVAPRGGTGLRAALEARGREWHSQRGGRAHDEM